jgi:hypothetical protein
VSASGNGPQNFGLIDHLDISAVNGSTMNLSGFLAGFVRLQNDTDSSTASTAVLDSWNTGHLSIEPLMAGTTFTAASGHNYIAVPEPTSLVLTVVGLALLPQVCRRKRAHLPGDLGAKPDTRGI